MDVVKRRGRNHSHCGHTCNQSGGETYTSTQNVTLTDTTAGASIYYTLDGSTPTTASTLYAGAIAISSSKTLKAIAAASGYNNSAVASATYVIQSGTGNTIDFSSGFAGSSGVMSLNGSTVLNNTRVALTTNGGQYLAGSAFYKTAVNIQSFTTDFNMQLSNPVADGMTFTIQGNGPASVGPFGGGLGYGVNQPNGGGAIPKSIAIKFDLFSNNGEGNDSTGLYQNGAAPTTPAIDLSTSGIDLHSGHLLAVHMSYDGTTLSMTITDNVAKAVYATSWTVNIPSIVGGNTAYVGFTAGTGGGTATQEIATWTFGSGN